MQNIFISENNTFNTQGFIFLLVNDNQKPEWAVQRMVHVNFIDMLVLRVGIGLQKGRGFQPFFHLANATQVAAKSPA